MPLLEQVLENNPDKVKIVLKNMPLKFHKFAAPAASAALAAGEQGKFWEFHDELFATPKLSMKAINDIAVKLQLDIAKFNADMTSPKVQQKLASDLADARDAGVTGTPTMFINGRQLKERTLPAFQKIIDEEFSKAAK
ncbi:MAG: thioredoxin domain-containing protein [Thermodesulfobacteriota bacterium]